MMTRSHLSHAWLLHGMVAAILLIALVGWAMVGSAGMARAQAATTVCGTTDSINNLGPYWINNNLWGPALALSTATSAGTSTHLYATPTRPRPA